jgi:hypothetical protein
MTRSTVVRRDRSHDRGARGGATPARYVRRVSERIFLSSPDVGAAERAALLAAFDSGWVAPVGPDLDAFEADLAGHRLAGSGGDVERHRALHLAMLVHGVQPGDDVLVSTFTFAATANAVMYTGATAALHRQRHDLVEHEPATAGRRTRRARRCGPAAGSRGGRRPLRAVRRLRRDRADLCAQYGVPLIEDAAEALLATYKGRPAGTLGACGIFSFNGNKIMTTSGGGALVSPPMSRWPTGSGTWPPRRASRRCTTSTPTSGSTTG